MLFLLTLFCLVIVSFGQDSCPYANYAAHQLEVYEKYGYSLINGTTPGLLFNESKYGVEGGQIVVVDDTFYLFITEFTGDPLWVPSNLAIWSCTMADFPFGWQRERTIFQSGGICDCNTSNNRASLGSSITVEYDETNEIWLTYYVGFQCCQDNSTYFYNRYGQIYVAKSTVPGRNGINAEYVDAGVVLKMDDNAQPWEGLQGDDSFSNLMYINDTYYSFYGSALTQDYPCCNQRVGLISSKDLYSGWTRMPYQTVNPISLANPNNYTEQPIPFKFSDGSYGAVYNALNHQSGGYVGYTWSPDGLTWNPACNQLLEVGGGEPQWSNQARTPQGLIPINDTHFYLFWSGYDGVENYYHEVFGYSRVRFVGS